MKELVRKIKKKYRVAVISSHVTGWVSIQDKIHGVSKEFHEQHFSYDYGVDKPDAELFIRAARKMKVNPKDCIVVDDMEKFLDSVKKTGARTILFKNAKQIKSELRKHGVKI